MGGRGQPVSGGSRRELAAIHTGFGAWEHLTFPPEATAPFPWPSLLGQEAAQFPGLLPFLPRAQFDGAGVAGAFPIGTFRSPNGSEAVAPQGL